MEYKDPAAAAGSTSYPGRGIIIGRSGDGEFAVTAYFIMGRSENSRNRVFVEDGEGIRTRAFDESALKDPSLIIYAPVRVMGGKTIVTNGDQTDTIFDALKEGRSFEDALKTRKFEPDAPNYTPRISGILNVAEGRFDYSLSILKSDEGNPSSCSRYFFHYEDPAPGKGHYIHTYRSDGNPLPSFEGEPEGVIVEGGIDGFTESIWNALDSDNRVSLFTRFIDIRSGKYESRMINKNV